MFSTRTKSGESTNDENILGSRQSDGRFYLVLRGDEYFGRDVWPALDWTRLPGITVEQKADAASDTYGYGTRTFAGGTGDGRNGVSAMELAPLDSVAHRAQVVVLLRRRDRVPDQRHHLAERQSRRDDRQSMAAARTRRRSSRAAMTGRCSKASATGSRRRSICRVARETRTRHLGLPRRLGRHDRAHEDRSSRCGSITARRR